MRAATLVTLALAALAALAGPAAASAGEPAMCGGFVKVAAGLEAGAGDALDYSAVKMHLYTAEGLLKYSTECAPNGYYFIPVYDQGDFRLRIEGPEGWNFEPAEAEVRLGDGHDGCAADIDFFFTGFSLSGAVEGAARGTCGSPAGEGPAGVRLDLLPAKGGKPVASTVSDAAGAFSFPGVLPGAYVVRASHAEWDVKPSQVPADMGFGNARLSRAFSVGGYSLGAAVRTPEGAPVEGVDVFLYAEGAGAAPACEADPAAGDAPASRAGAPACSARTGADGLVRFDGVPCGEYELVAQYRRGRTAFVVRPGAETVRVAHGDAAEAASFAVVGFTAHGRVVDADGNGVAGARVSVDGAERAVTDAEGRYTLDGVSRGTYAVAASAEHLFFEPVAAARLEPLAAEVPPLRASRVHLCGRVGAAAASEEPAAGRRVTLSPGGAQTTTGAGGAYCFEVASGVEYTVRPEQTAAERDAGVRLAPAERRVPVGAAPVLHADFSQARVAVSGSVLGLVEGAADEGVTVRLALQPEGAHSFKAEAAAGAGGAFEFRGVFPGTYRVTASRGGWCWEGGAAGVEVRVEKDDVEGVELRHAGYRLAVEAPHEVAEATLRAAGTTKKGKRRKATKHALRAGLNELCVRREGEHELRPGGCFRYGGADSFAVDTAAAAPLRLAVSEARVCGVVRAPRAGGDAGLPATLEVRAGGEAAEARLQEDGDSYRYCVWAAPGSTLELSVPVAPSAGLVFHPRRLAVRVPARGCPPEAGEFEGRAGRFVSGTVSPAVAGVRVAVRLAGEPDDAEVVVAVETRADGTYRAGPLYDDEEYAVRAESEDYHFVEERAGHFKALRLARVTVQVRDEEGSPLEAALLSLSGHGGYRQNKATDAAGVHSFPGLFPGAYFLRPLLKEYEFEPRQVSIDVAEAEDERVELRARRVAWSARGTVRALNGEAEPRVVVEARLCGADGDACVAVEETVTDNAGEYRLRGLVPGKRYEVAVKPATAQSNAHVDHASPASAAVRVDAKADAAGLDFVVFSVPAKFDVTGTATAAAEEDLDTLTVELCRAAAPATPVQTLRLSAALPFFEFTGVPAGDYVVRAKTSLSSRSHNFELPERRVSLKARHAHVELAFEASPKVAEEEQLGQGNLISLFVFAGLVLAALNWQTVGPLVDRVRGVETAAPAAPAASGATAADATGGARRRQRNRR